MQLGVTSSAIEQWLVLLRVRKRGMLRGVRMMAAREPWAFELGLVDSSGMAIVPPRHLSAVP